MVEKVIIRVVSWTIIGAVVTTSLTMTVKSLNYATDKLEQLLPAKADTTTN